MAYQNLCLTNLRLLSRPFLALYDLFFPGDYRFFIKTNGVFFGSVVKGLNSSLKESFEQLDPFAMDDEQFQIVKDYAMRHLTIQMTNSMNLAKLIFDLVVGFDHFFLNLSSLGPSLRLPLKTSTVKRKFIRFPWNMRLYEK